MFGNGKRIASVRGKLAKDSFVMVVMPRPTDTQREYAFQTSGARQGSPRREGGIHGLPQVCGNRD